MARQDTGSRRANAEEKPESTKRFSRRAKVFGAIVGAMLAGSAAYAVSNWAVGLQATSHGQGKSASVTGLIISATATPTPTNLLYPSGSGDVVLQVTNPNPFPVTLSALKLPANTVFGGGYSTSALSSAKTGCSTTSGATGTQVIWTGATATSGTTHPLATPLKVAAANTASPLKVTLTNEATMGVTSPTACQATYFKMPSLIGVTATVSITGSPTTGPTTDSYS